MITLCDLAAFDSSADHWQNLIVMTDEQPPRRPRGGIVKEIMTDPQQTRPTKPDPRGRALLLPVSGGRAKHGPPKNISTGRPRTPKPG
jgi:hypothetical protein